MALRRYGNGFERIGVGSGSSLLPKRSPELDPDEQVWNEIKNNQIGKQPINHKRDLKQRLYSALRSLQRHSERIRSFFQLPDTLYASMPR